MSGKGLTIAVEGCGHGDLDNIYATMKEAERQKGIKIDLLICCGDFEVRGARIACLDFLPERSSANQPPRRCATWTTWSAWRALQSTAT